MVGTSSRRHGRRARLKGDPRTDEWRGRTRKAARRMIRERSKRFAQGLLRRASRRLPSPHTMVLRPPHGKRTCTHVLLLPWQARACGLGSTAEQVTADLDLRGRVVLLTARNSTGCRTRVDARARHAPATILALARAADKAERAAQEVTLQMDRAGRFPMHANSRMRSRSGLRSQYRFAKMATRSTR